MKKIRWFHVLLIGIISAIGTVLIACGGDEDKSKPAGENTSSAVGVYYNDDSGEEYLLSLNKDYTVSIGIGNVALSGKYSMSGDNITFDVKSTALAKAATYKDDTVTVTYDGKTVKFWRNVSYNVSFDSKGGSAVNSVPVRNGKTLEKPANPTRSGDYVFVGWYKDGESYANRFVFGGERITSDITLYARWIEIDESYSTFTVKFDLGYDDKKAGDKTTVNGKVYDVDPPTRDGYEFKGWWIKDGGEYSLRVDLENYEFTENTTVYAMWQTMQSSDKLSAPIVDITEDGIVWDAVENAQSYRGKVTDPDGGEEQIDVAETRYEYSFGKPGTYRIELYAVSGASDDKNSEITVRIYTASKLARVSVFNVNGNVLTFNPVENAENYLIYINCGDSQHEHDPIDNEDSTAYDFSDCIMQKDGITFKVVATATGYISSESEVYTVNRTLDKATDFAFDGNTQILSWGSVKNATDYTVSVECGDNSHNHTEVSVKTPSYDLKTCAPKTGGIKVTVTANAGGYNSSEASEYSVDKTAAAAPRDIKVKGEVLSWTGDAQSYVVSIDGKEFESEQNSKDLTECADVVWTVGKKYAIKVAAVKNNVRSPWSDEVQATYKAMTDVTYVNGRAHWSPVIGADSYEVVVNDGEPTPVEGVSSAPVALPAKTNEIKVCYVDGADKSEQKSVGVNAYEVVFDSVGGSAIDSIYYAKGDSMSLTSELTKRGYDFFAWYSTEAGNGLRYTDGTVFNADNDITLYARWVGKEYTVTLNYNRTGDENDEIKKVKVTYGKLYEFPVPLFPKTAMHGFTGWNLDKDGQGVVMTDEFGVGLDSWNIADSSLVVYAMWDTVLAFDKAGSGANTHYIVRKGNATLMVSELTIPTEYKADGDDRAYPVTVIGGNAFTSSKSLTKITIPVSVTTIELTAFNYCDALINISIQGGKPFVTDYWSDNGVLFGLEKTTGKSTVVYCPLGKRGSYIVPDGIEEIAYESFKSANIDTLIIPASITRVSGSAFISSKINNIIFDDAKQGNVSSETLKISEGAFKNLYSLTSITFPSREFVFIDESGETPENVEYKANLFSGCNALATVEVKPGNAKFCSIDGMLCKYDDDRAGITVVYCPNKYVFVNGTLNLDNRITAIGDKAFSNCSNLRRVVIGTSIKYIGEHAFSGYMTTVAGKNVYVSACTTLSKVTFEGGRVVGLEIGNAAFGTDYNGDRFSIPGSFSSIYAACAFINTLDFQEGCNVTKIGDYAFSRCKVFKVVLPDSVNTVGNSAFKDCGNLYNIEFLDKGLPVTFGENVFMNCSRLESVKLPNNITEFLSGSFSGCDALEKIEFGENNPSLEFVDGVLYGKKDGSINSILFIPAGTDFTNFVIPDEITDISAGAFSNVKGNIQELVINKYVTHIGAGAFAQTGIKKVTFLNKENDDDDGADTLVIDGSETLYTEGLFYACADLEEVVLPARLKAIPSGMFASCSSLTSIDLSGVEEIGNYAFYNSGLADELVIPKSVVAIGASAFNGCKSITKITFEDDREKDLVMLNSDGIVDGLDNNNEFVKNSLSSMTFAYCSELLEVHLPEKLINLSSSMFSSCGKLTAINIPASVKSIRYSAFSSCSGLQNISFAERPDANELYLEDGATSGNSPPTYSGVFKDCKVENYVFPAGTVCIPKYCFYNNTTLKTVYIPNTVRNLVNEQGKDPILAIGNSAFSGCKNLTQVEFEADDPADLANDNYPGFSVSGTLSGNKLTTITLPARLSDYWASKSAQTTTSALGAFNGTAYTSISIMSGNDKYSSDDGIIYNLDKTELLFCPRGKTGKVTVPYAISLIAENAFNNCKITGIAFAPKPAETETVAESEDGEEATGIPDALVIGTSAFAASKIAGELKIPARVTQILDSAFLNCSAVTKLTFETDANVSEIGKQAFYGCTKLAGTLTIPASVESIGEKAFSASNGLTSITTLNFADDASCALTKIDANAFEKIGISSVRLPDTVSDVGDNLFANCAKLTTASVPKTVNNFNGMFLNCQKLTDLQFRSVSGKEDKLEIEETGAIYSSDGKKLYSYPSNVIPGEGTETEGVLTIRDGVEEIAPVVFANNNHIKKVIIPNTVNVIGNQAFYNMFELEEVVFTDDNEQTEVNSLVFNGESTFAGCPKLKKVSLPKRLQSLSKYAFRYCSGLKDIAFAEGCKLALIPDQAFEYVGAVENFVIPENVQEVGSNVFRYGELKNVTIPASLNKIGSGMFSTCAELISVTFVSPARARENFKTISSMFKDCSKLVSVVLPNDLKELSSSSFENCVNLQSINLPDSLVTIGSSAFKACSALSKINSDNSGTLIIPKNVSKVDTSAFYGCANITLIQFAKSDAATLELKNQCFAGTGITSIVIPNNVNSIGCIFSEYKSNVFYGCGSLQTVEFESGNSLLKSIPDNMFIEMKNLKTVILPRGLTGSNVLNIGYNAFKGSGISSIVIPAETQKINYSAFEDCTNLNEVVFEKNSSGTTALEWLGNKVFKNTAIVSVTIPKSVKFQSDSSSYSDEIFANCKSLTRVEFENDSAIMQFEKDNPYDSDSAKHFLNCTALKAVELPQNLIIIDRNLFEGCTSLERITIPASVRTIDNYAFYKSGLKTVTLGSAEDPSILSFIGNYAFASTGLTRFAAPATLTEIGSSAFSGCASLGTFTYAGSGLRSVGDYAFNGCNSLRKIVIPDSVTHIGTSAYQNCDLVTEVEIPVSLKTMGNNPFINCDLLSKITIAKPGNGETPKFTVDGGALYSADKSILYSFFDRSAASFTLLPETAEIRNNAFWGMPLKTVKADVRIIEEGDGLVIGGSAFRYSAISSIELGKNVDIGSMAFANCNSLTEIVIPDGARIGSEAFINSAVNSVVLSGSATYCGYGATFGDNAVLTINGKDGVIENGAFSGDESLTSIVIAEGVTAIGETAFWNCVNLTSVVFPSTLKTIGTNAFRDTSLSALNLPNSVTEIGNLAFVSNTASITGELILPTELTKVGTNAFAGLGMSSVTFGKKVKTLPTSSMFYWKNSSTKVEFNCSNLTTIIFESGNTVLTSIPNNAFQYVSSLTSVTLPENITSIGNSAFEGTGLSSVTIPVKVTKIGTSAFKDVTNLTEFIITRKTDGTSALTEIGASAFKNTGLTGELSIPQSVKTLGTNAFEDCSGITSVVFEGASNLTKIDKFVFSGTKISTVTIPAKVTAINESAFDGCDQLSAVNFTKNSSNKYVLTSINKNAFKDTAITEFTVPESVTSLYPAFEGCKLTTVTLSPATSSSAFSLGTFKGITSLTTVVIPEKVTAIAQEMFSGCTNISSIVIPSTVTTVKDMAFAGWTDKQTIYFTGITAPLSGFSSIWYRYCNANIVWNYTPGAETPEVGA